MLKQLFSMTGRALLPLAAVPGAIALALVLVAPPALADEDANPDPVNELLVGGQAVDVDGEHDSDRTGKFEDQQDHPEGVVLDELDWSIGSGDGLYWLRLSLDDLLQEDQQHLLRADLGNHVRLRLEGFASRNVYGDGAVTLHSEPSRGELRIADESQRLWQDPNGDGVIANAADDLLLPPLVYDALDGLKPFQLDTERDRNRFLLQWQPLENWTWDFEYIHDKREGQRPFGTGTYGRNNQTQNYYFTVMGSELPAPVDWVTDDFRIGTSYFTKHFFGSIEFESSRFENDVNSLTYDNPFFYTDVAATGSTRGRWEEGRATLEPDNEAWNLNLTAGFRFARSTQFTVLLSQGELTNDDEFVPLTTNTAQIGRVDLDGNGVVNAADDPTVTSTLPRASFDGESETSNLGFTFTSRPADWVQVNASYRDYEYDSKQDRIDFRYRSDYVDSGLLATVGGGPIFSEPFDYSRSRWSIDAVFRPHEAIGIKPFYFSVDTDYDVYEDEDGDHHTDGGTRSVSGTSEERYGLAVMFSIGDKVDGHASYASTSRDYDGEYHPHWGADEREGLEHFDLSENDGSVWEIELGFSPTDLSRIGVHYQETDIDYDADYGVQGTKDAGYGVDFGVTVGIATISGYWEHSDSDFETFLRTKCSNCTPGAPWDVPGSEWWSDVDDSWDSYGLSLDFAINDKTSLSLRADISDMSSRTRSDNTEPPPGESTTAYDFPEVETGFDEYELEFDRKVTDKWGFLARYTYQQYDQEDYATEDLTPYAADSTVIDHALRYLFLDSRFEDYDAHIFELLFSLTF